MHTFSRRLQTQLMAVFIVTITLLITLVSIFSYQQAKKVIEEQSASIMQQQFMQNQYTITAFTNEVENVMRLLITQESMREYMRKGNRGDFASYLLTRDIFDHANAIMRSYDYVDSIYYFGSDGTAIGVMENENQMTRDKAPGHSWYGEKLQQEASGHMGQMQWFGGYENWDFSLREKLNDEEEDIPYISVACPVYLFADRYVTVIINIRQSYFVGLLSGIDTAGMGESYLIDGDKTIIVHRQEEVLGHKAELDLEEFYENGSGYVMEDQIQINYHLLPRYSWWLVTEIPKEVLYGNLVSLKWWFVLFAAAGLLSALALYAYSIHRLTAPLKSLREAMERMENGSLGEQLDESSRNELGMLGRQFNHMSRSIHEMVNQIRDTEQEKSILEKEALQAQMNPHFLFNTLSNMRFMAKFGQKEMLEECFTALGNMLLPLYRSEGSMWTLRQELDYLSHYLVIMNKRFAEKIELEFEIQDCFMELYVPKFILQPLVENAVEHGFVPKGGAGMILLGAEQKEACLTLYVEDNGLGMEPEEQERLRCLLEEMVRHKELYRNHVGVVNVHRRLRVQFGAAYGVRLESIPKEATCFYLDLPVITEEMLNHYDKTENNMRI